MKVILSAMVPLLGACASGASPEEQADDLTRVSDGVYTFRWHLHRNLVVVTSAGVVVVDPLNVEAARALKTRLRDVTDLPVTHVLYSHDHWDHILGAGVFREDGAVVLCHEAARPSIDASPHPDLAPPDRTFGGAVHEFQVGRTTLELRHFGPNHGHGMIVVRLPEARILYTPDLVTPRAVGFRFLPDYDPIALIRTLREIEALDFDRIIPGHLAPVAPASAVREQRRYFEDLMDAVGRAMESGVRDPARLRREIRLARYEDWFGYEEWFPLNVERAWAYYHMGW